MTKRPANTALIAVLVVVFAIAGAVVWYMVTNQPETADTNTVIQTNTTSTNTAETDAARGVPEVPSVNSETDLTAAEDTLREVDFENDGGDSALLDSYMSEF